MKSLEKLKDVTEIESLSGLGISLFIFLISIYQGYTNASGPFLVSLIAFEAGIAFSISLTLLLIRLMSRRSLPTFEDANRILDDLSSTPSAITAPFGAVKAQTIQIVDKRTKGKRKAEVIGEMGETF